MLKGTSGTGTATLPAVQIKTGADGATKALTVLNNGNVGIGTTNSAIRLNIVGDGSTGKISINGGSAATSQLTYNTLSIGDANHDLRLTSMTSGNSGLQMSVLSEIEFRTADPAFASRMVIQKQGRVGIATNAPSRLLHLGGTNAVIAIEQRSTTNSPATIATAVQLWVADGELYTTDGSGNVTLQSTHEGETPVHKSHNLYTGKGRVVDLDAVGLFMDAIVAGKDLKGIKDTLTAAGKTTPYRTYEVPRTDWDEEQADKKAKVDLEIAEKTKAVAAWEAEAAAFEELTPEEQKERPLPEKPVVPDPYTVRPKPQWLTDALAAEEGK